MGLEAPFLKGGGVEIELYQNKYLRETNYKKSIGKSKKFRFFDMNRDE